MSHTPEFYTDRANAAFTRGFTSKAAQKSATDDLNRAHELCCLDIQNLVLAIDRDGQSRYNPPGDYRLQGGDELFVLCKQDHMGELRRLISGPA